MTSEENAEPEPDTSMPPLPVKVEAMKLFIARAAKLETLKAEVLAVILMTELGGL